MISVTLNKNNKDEYSCARIEINGSIMTMDYIQYKELVKAINSPKIINYRGEQINN